MSKYASINLSGTTNTINTNNLSNGLFEETNDDNNTMPTNLTSQQIEENPVSLLYFSKENIKRIQKTLKKEIYVRTHGNFVLEVDQDINDLIIVMRSVYFQYAKFQPTQIVRQVKELNTITVNIIVPDMITEIKQEYEYLKEINRPINPILRPTNINTGKQTLPSITTMWV